MLGDGEGVVTLRLAIPPRDAGEPMRDIFYLDVEGRGIEQVETPPAQHALPRPRRFEGFAILAAGRLGHDLSHFQKG